MISVFNGILSVIELHSNKVILCKKNFLGRTKSEITIPLEQISDIQLRRAGMLNNGYIEFITPKLKMNEGIIQFKETRDSNTDAENFINEVKSLMSPPDNTSLSKSQELMRLKQLLDDNVITKEEFDKLKQEVINI